MPTDTTAADVDYEAVIGLEVHSQLLTRSKMFCACSSEYQDASPNTVVCNVCLGMPGVLPVVNERAVDLAIATGLALDCTISELTKFDRKNYPYPDLMKGYQISQFDRPVAYGGRLEFDVDGASKSVRITRVHLEEDVAKLLHRSDAQESYSLLDINRAGVPLMEVVSEPDMRSAGEARAYLVALRSILRYIGASTANMEEGSFRCDANVSVRPRGEDELGSKVEVKNMNSFRSVYSAIEYEIARQSRMRADGERVAQETRGWVEDRGVTVSQRSKEYASDYRYFPEPDLPPLAIGPEWVRRLREGLPELPAARRERFVSDYGIPPADADLLVSSKAGADLLDAVVDESSATGKARRKRARSAGNWINGELAALLNAEGAAIEDKRIEPAYLVQLLDMVDTAALSTSMARTVLEEMYNTGRSPREIVDKAGIAQISDADAVQAAVDGAVSENPQPVADYLGGKENALRFLVGQVMKATRGKANPQMASELLRDKLESMR